MHAYSYERKNLHGREHPSRPLKNLITQAPHILSLRIKIIHYPRHVKKKHYLIRVHLLRYESTYTYLHQAALFGTLTLPYSPRNNELFSHLLHFMNIKILCTLHIYICIHMYMRMFILYLTYLIDISGHNLFSNLLFYEDKTTMVLSFVRLRRDVEELIP